MNIGTHSIPGLIERNYWSFWRYLGTSPGVSTYDEPEMLRVVTESSFAPFNGIMRTRLVDGSIDERIESALEPFRERGVPALWWIEPSSLPADLAHRLADHGLTKHASAPGMALELHHFEYGSTAGSSVSVRRVSNLDMLKNFAAITGAGFGLPRSAVDFVLRAFGALSFEVDSPLRHYLGYVAQAPNESVQPVAVATMMLADESAGLYNVTALPAVRGKGYGAALAAIPLQEARREKYQHAVLHSSREGYNLYRHMGFREYCTFHSYLWPGTA